MEYLRLHQPKSVKTILEYYYHGHLNQIRSVNLQYDTVTFLLSKTILSKILEIFVQAERIPDLTGFSDHLIRHSENENVRLFWLS